MGKLLEKKEEEGGGGIGERGEGNREMLRIPHSLSFFLSENLFLFRASYLDYYSQEATRIHGDVISTPVASRRLIVLKQLLECVL